MNDCSYTRYLLEDLRILHIDVFSSVSLSLSLVYYLTPVDISHKVSQETIRLPTINLLHYRVNEPCHEKKRTIVDAPAVENVSISP
jgi:hypothetical protein